MKPKKTWLEDIQKLTKPNIKLWVPIQCEKCLKYCTTRRNCVISKSGDTTLHICRSCHFKDIMINQSSYTIYHIDGTVVREIRKATGLTAEDIGKKCKWSKSYQCRIERSTSFQLSEEACKDLCKAIGIPLETLIKSKK